MRLALLLLVLPAFGCLLSPAPSTAPVALPDEARLAGPASPPQLDQSLTDLQVPIDLHAYGATRVEWENGRPVRATVERWMRGRCYVRNTYALVADGSRLLPIGEPLRAGHRRDGRAPGEMLAPDAAAKLGRGSEATLEKAGKRRPSWVFARDPEHPGREVIISFHYDLAGCLVPREIARNELPHRRRVHLPTQTRLARTSNFLFESDVEPIRYESACLLGLRGRASERKRKAEALGAGKATAAGAPAPAAEPLPELTPYDLEQLSGAWTVGPTLERVASKSLLEILP